MRIWITVMFFLAIAAGCNCSMTLPQCSILSHDKLSVCCITELSVTLPCVWKISHCPDIIPDPSGKVQDPLLQNIGFHMWQLGNTGVMMLPTALSFHICGHFPALLADTPNGLTCNRRARWRSICWSGEYQRSGLGHVSGRAPTLDVICSKLSPQILACKAIDHQHD